nr:uncharacterized protein LOC109160522 [Ipomoea batatas]
MGFRSLQKFIVALLAKQGWRLINTPTSLVARLLKAKYHPNSHFLEASLGNNVNYTWRSIMAGKDLLKQGLRVRISIDSLTSIWHSPWLLDDVNPFLAPYGSHVINSDGRICFLIQLWCGARSRLKYQVGIQLEVDRKVLIGIAPESNLSRVLPLFVKLMWHSSLI